MRFLRVLLLMLISSSALVAQGDVFARARRLVNDGDAKAGRALVDSVLAAAPAGSAAYGEALYWRGVLAEDGEAARTDLLRVAIEFPLSARASEALLRVAQLEFTRGDREAARKHLDRLMRDHPDAPTRAAARYWMGRLLLEDSKPVEACGALRDARQLAAKGDIELINQIEFYARPCDAIAFSAKAIADSTAAADSARKNAEATHKAAVGTRKSGDGPRKGADAANAAGNSSSAGRWSVQLASYGDSDHDEALGLVKRLTKRGYDARVTANKPWRVRVGHYATRAEAAEVAKKFSSKKSKALVVEAEDR